MRSVMYTHTPQQIRMRRRDSRLSRKSASRFFQPERVSDWGSTQMWKLRDKYTIAGIGWTDYFKNSGRTVRSLASEACLKAIDDSGLNVKDIDGFVSFNFNDSVPAIAVATEIGGPAARYAMDFLIGGTSANIIILPVAGA